MLTREADYALRTIDYLVNERSDRPVSARVLADELGVPYRFERRIVTRLREAGLVTSRRGGNGGVSLAGDPGQLTLLDVVKAVGDRSVALNQCTVGDAAECERSGFCRVRPKLLDVQQRFIALLAETPVADSP